jgi:transcriptional regulator MraZ
MDANISQPIFAGEFRHAIDAKNRVTIPSRWRSGEVDEFFAVPNPENGSLMVMPIAVTHEVAARAKSDPRFTPQDVQRFIRQFYSRAQHLTTDKQGRIVLPEEHCRQLGLKGEVVLVGSHSRFEVWSPEAWQKVREEDAPTFHHMLGVIGI